MELSGIADADNIDIVVLGAGAAGMATALFASLAGLSPLVVERTEFVGGSTAYSAGSAWIPNTRHAQGAGDSVERAATYLRNVIGNGSSEAMRRAFLEAGPAAVDLLEDKTDVHFRARPLHPDYETDVEGSTLWGRVLEAKPVSGRELGPLLALVRPPIPEFTILGGLMVNQTDVGHLLNMHRSPASLLHAARILGGHVRDLLFYRRSMRLMMGNALAARLLLSLAKRNVAILTRTEVVEIEAGGAVRLRQGATERRIAAKRAVVLATGGLGRHPAFRETLYPPGVTGYNAGAPGHTGAAHDLALAIGARHGSSGGDAGFWTPMSVKPRPDGSTAVFSHFLLDRGKPGVIAVSQEGRRFVNENVSYHRFVQGMLAVDDPRKVSPAFLIADERALRSYGLGMVRPGRSGREAFQRDGYLVSAPTLEALAGQLGIDATALAETVARFNRFAENGRDEDFGRGETDYQRITTGDPNHKPHPALAPLVEPPFHAVRIYPGEIGTSKGLVTDVDGRLLNVSGQPIAGLYACGNDMQSVMGGQYPGPGINLGPAIVFAYRVVEHIRGASGGQPQAV